MFWMRRPISSATRNFRTIKDILFPQSTSKVELFSWSDGRECTTLKCLIIVPVRLAFLRSGPPPRLFNNKKFQKKNSNFFLCHTDCLWIFHWIKNKHWLSLLWLSHKVQCTKIVTISEGLIPTSTIIILQLFHPPLLFGLLYY